MTLRSLVVSLGHPSVDRVGTWRGAHADPRTAAALLTTGCGPTCPVLGPSPRRPCLDPGPQCSSTTSAGIGTDLDERAMDGAAPPQTWSTLA